MTWQLLTKGKLKSLMALVNTTGGKTVKVDAADITNGVVGTTQLTTAVGTSLGKADTAVQPAALPAYLLAVTSGQRMFRNTQNVTGTLQVDLSATFSNIDEVVAVLGADPSVNATVVSVTIPTQTGADAGKFTLKVWKPTTAGAAGNPDLIASSTSTALHYIGIGTPV